LLLKIGCFVSFPTPGVAVLAPAAWIGSATVQPWC
jgi:hypothetical protein